MTFGSFGTGAGGMAAVLTLAWGVGGRWRDRRANRLHEALKVTVECRWAQRMWPPKEPPSEVRIGVANKGEHEIRDILLELVRSDTGQPTREFRPDVIGADCTFIHETRALDNEWEQRGPDPFNDKVLAVYGRVTFTDAVGQRWRRDSKGGREVLLRGSWRVPRSRPRVAV